MAAVASRRSSEWWEDGRGCQRGAPELVLPAGHATRRAPKWTTPWLMSPKWTTQKQAHALPARAREFCQFIETTISMCGPREEPRRLGVQENGRLNPNPFALPPPPTAYASSLASFLQLTVRNKSLGANGGRAGTARTENQHHASPSNQACAAPWLEPTVPELLAIDST